MTKHCAKFSKPILDTIELVLVDSIENERIPKTARVLDPFAGVGGVHSLTSRPPLRKLRTVGVEIEPEWADAHERTEVGDALALRFRANSFDALVTSPCYGNRMADHHDARDTCKTCDGSGCTVASCLAAHPDDGNEHGICETCDGSGLSKRNTYKATLGRDPSRGSSAIMQWGTEYRDFHEAAWREAQRVVRSDGLIVVNVSNHVRGGVVQPVVEWHLNCWLRLGALLDRVVSVQTQRNRHGANGSLRVRAEHVLVLTNTKGTR